MFLVNSVYLPSCFVRVSHTNSGLVQKKASWFKAAQLLQKQLPYCCHALL